MDRRLRRPAMSREKGRGAIADSLSLQPPRRSTADPTHRHWRQPLPDAARPTGPAPASRAPPPPSAPMSRAPHHPRGHPTHRGPADPEANLGRRALPHTQADRTGEWGGAARAPNPQRRRSQPAEGAGRPDRSAPLATTPSESPTASRRGRPIRLTSWHCAWLRPKSRVSLSRPRFAPIDPLAPLVRPHNRGYRDTPKKSGLGADHQWPV